MEDYVFFDLTTEQRMQMIQEGYNPLQADSVKRWLDKEKPDHVMAKEVAKASGRQNLGSGHQDDNRDYGEIYGDNQRSSSSGGSGDPREQLREMVNTNYDYGGGDINSAIKSRLEARKTLGGGKQQQTAQTQRGPIQSFRETTEPEGNLITEAKEASKTGYKRGIGYLNAFVRHIKNPTSKTRQGLVEKINEMVTMEENVSQELIKYYRGGIAKAEKQLYSQLKKKKD